MSDTVVIESPQHAPTTYRNLFARMPDVLEQGELDFPEYDKKSKAAAPTYENVAYFLERFGICVVWNEFAIDYYVAGVPNCTVMDDNAINDIWATMHRAGLEISLERLRAFLCNIGNANRVHPMRNRFDKLQAGWDGKPRLDMWLHDFCGVENNEYTRFVARSTLMMQVRRIRQPGFDYKYIPILEGKQGIGKSPILRVLAFDKHFNENLEIGASGKDVISQSRNVMIHELGELANLTKRDAETFKAFTSRVHDRDRLPYAKSDTEIPRHFLFWGNTNRQDYNRDETGNDRMLSVLCNNDITSDKPLLIDELRAELPQIYGEAAMREVNATRDDLHPRGGVVQLHRVEQDKRYYKDGYFEAIEMALEDVDTAKGAFVPTRELVKACLPGVDVFNPSDTRLTKAVAAAMLKLGWVSKRRKIRVKAYGNGKVTDGLVVRPVSGYVKGNLADGYLDVALTYDKATGTMVPTLNPSLDA